MTVLSVVERAIGFFYRIFLSRTISQESLGLYQITLSVVGVLVTLTASGIPITVSRLMIKNRAKGDFVGSIQVVYSGILTSLIISLPLTLILYFFRSQLSFIFADSRCYDLLIIILPSIVITSVYAVIRGYFWGNKNFLAYSIIELIEEIAMVIFGVFLVKNSGVYGASKAVFYSYVVSFTLSTFIFIMQSGKPQNPIKQLKPLIASSSPITAMRTLTSLISAIVSIIIPKRLIAIGMESKYALEMFGILSGMTLPILFIPSTIIGSIALVIVPKLSESFYSNQAESLCKSINSALDYSILISVFFIPIFVSCGEALCLFIFNNQSAGEYLVKSAIIMLPMAITMITNSILNSLGKEGKTLINFLLGAFIMFLSIVFLPTLFKEYSLIIGYGLFYLVTGILNLIALSKITYCGRSYFFRILQYIVAIIPPIIFGLLIKNLLKNLPTILIITISTLSVSIFNLLSLNLFNIVELKELIKNGLKMPIKVSEPKNKLRYIKVK